MIYSGTDKKVSFPEEQSEIIKVMFLYRYLSLMVTSIFYLMSKTNHLFGTKLFIVTCILVAAIILNYLYVKNRNSVAKIKLLVFIETIGNTIILIPSGGLESPYVWYSLNTILIVSIVLKKRYAWINLFIYLFASTWLSFFILNLEQFSFLNLVKDKSNLILSFLLITAAMQVLAKYTQDIQNERIKLARANTQLIAANSKVRDSIAYIMELYSAVQLFTALRNKNELIELIKQYTKKITKTDSVIFYTWADYQNQKEVKANETYQCLGDMLKLKISEKWDNIIENQRPLLLHIEHKSFIFVPVKSDYMVFGILGIETVYGKEGSTYQDNIDQLQFLAQLSSIVLERFELEQVNERLLVSHEQNRIANEIHDSALQRIFGVSCAIFTLIKNLEKTTVIEIEEELNIIRSSLNISMKELRSIIYGLSWKKDGINNFIEDTRNYIEEIRRLNSIEITFNVIGNDELLSCLQKKAIYRIVSEGISNALRHGQATQIDVILIIENSVVFLKVIDNGTGFNINQLNKNNEQGLGISNIQYLVNSLNGVIDVQSKYGKGTKLLISFPNSPSFIKGEVV